MSVDLDMYNDWNVKILKDTKEFALFVADEGVLVRRQDAAAAMIAGRSRESLQSFMSSSASEPASIRSRMRGR